MAISKKLKQAHLLDELTSGVIVSNSNTTTAVRTAGIIPAGGTGLAEGAWDTAANRDTAITTMGEMKDTINNIRVDVDSIKSQLDSLLAVLRTNRLIPQ